MKISWNREFINLPWLSFVFSSNTSKNQKMIIFKTKQNLMIQMFFNSVTKNSIVDTGRINFNLYFFLSWNVFDLFHIYCWYLHSFCCMMVKSLTWFSNYLIYSCSKSFQEFRKCWEKWLFTGFILCTTYYETNYQILATEISTITMIKTAHWLEWMEKFKKWWFLKHNF